MHWIFQLLWAIPAYFLYLFLSSYMLMRKNNRKALELNCLPTPRWPTKDKLGLKPLYEMTKASKEGLELQYFVSKFEEASKHHGFPVHTISGSFLGMNFLVTRDPKNVQAILATQFKEFDLGSVRYTILAPLLGHGIFAADGPQWEHARALLRPQFARGQISDLHMEETHVQNFLKAVPSAADGWTDAVDLMPLFFRFTLDSATEFLFGESVNTQLAAIPGYGNEAKAKQDAEFVDAFDYAVKCSSDMLRLGDFAWWGMTKEYKQACEKVHKWADPLVRKALSPQFMVEKKSDRYIFIEQLAQVTNDPVEIRDQLLSILIAGRDTTAGLLSFLWLRLSQKPAVLAKLRREVIEALGTTKEGLSYESLKACTYLQYCLSEALRLYPSVPGNSRRSTTDTTLPRGGGPDGQSPIFIPKGTEVNYLVYATHRHSDWWGEDAEEFRPERWEKRKAGWEFLPFNGGPRICLGQQFALTQAGYVTVRLLQTFDQVDGTVYHGDYEKWMLTLTGRPWDGTKLRLHSAEKA